MDNKITTLKVDGGASANNFLMQFQSDILNAEVLRPACIETTAMGAAFLAGLYTGVWTSKEELKKLISIERRFSPLIDDNTRNKALERWSAAIELTRRQLI